MKVLAWRFDHIGDCNRYGNCVDHPYFEPPRREELTDYPGSVPSGATSLEYVPVDAMSEPAEADRDSKLAFDQLRDAAGVLRASVGEALHSIQRERIHEVEKILDAAMTDFDRVWSFRQPAQPETS